MNFFNNESGATAIEYGMLLAGVSIVMSVAMIGFTSQFVAASDMIITTLSVI